MAVDLFARIADKSKLIFKDKVIQQATTELELMSRSAGRAFIEQAQIYPPENSGNRPPHPYWERGTGRILSNGTVSPPSQNLGQSWNLQGFKTPFGGTVRVTNPVAYLPWVHDNEKQAWFHAKNGWKTISQLSEAAGIEVQKTGDLQYRATRADSLMEQARNKIQNFMQNLLR